MAIDAFRSPVCSGRLFITLGRWLICTVFVYAAASTSAQVVTFQHVPEFEKWIQEADKSKKDPVDLALEKGKGEDWASRLDAYMVKRKLAPIAAENAKLDAEAKEREVRIAKLDAEAKESEARIAKKVAELLKQTKVVLAAMKTLEAQGRLGPDAVADLNKMANNDLEEVRVLVRREFGKYLKP
jgi:hypothetical protein